MLILFEKNKAVSEYIELNVCWNKKLIYRMGVKKCVVVRMTLTGGFVADSGVKCITFIIIFVMVLLLFFDENMLKLN